MTRSNSMSFTTNNGGNLKTAIKVLSSINPKGFGIIEVDPQKGFKISSLSDLNSGIVSFFELEPSKLIDFECRKPLKKKMVNLKFLLRMLQAIEEEGINLFVEDGSSNLSFGSVLYPGMILGVGMQESNAAFEAYSDTMSHTCEAILPTEGLKLMIPEMVKDGVTKLVTMDITVAETKMSIGTVEWEFKSNMETGGNTGMAQGQRHHVEFLWSHVESLENALTLAEQYSFALLPSDNIKFQFQFEEGSLVYIKKPLAVTTQ